ncbi:MAG TPA: 2-dehydropantoate 2-reductase [Candidatus Acidoferrales bacterium]|nr:2-dehydropantoate 2-reductase [Candidatus Acidoferrales bacterium]
MRVAVVGPGGIGGFAAAALARAGHDVSVVGRGAHLEAVRRAGLTVDRSDIGAFRTRVRALADARELGTVDVALLAFKAHHWPSAIGALEPLGATDTTIVTLQNGVPFWYVRKPPLASVDPGGRIGTAFDDAHVVGAVVHVSGHVASPGHVVQSGGLRYVFGTPQRGQDDARAHTVVDLFASAGLAPELDPDVRATVWLKLVNNAGLNPASALHGMTLRALLEDPAARADARALMEEALAVGQALGVVREVDIEARLAYAARLADVKTSMLQDFEAGRDLELDPISGAIIELGERCGVPVPRTREAYHRLRALQPPRTHG